MLSDFEKLWLAFLMKPKMKEMHFVILPDLSVQIGSMEWGEFISEWDFPTLSLAIQFLAEQTKPDKEAGKDSKNVEGN